MAFEMILTEKRGPVGLVTLNRPAAMNALNNKLLHELMDALEEFDRDESVGAIVVTGSDRAFAAGADIKEMARLNLRELLEGQFIATFARINALRKPLIAAVAGWALGGGCEIALACDMIVAAETARFGQPEVAIGVIPGAGGTQRLPRRVGKAIAMEMILNGRTLSAQEALQLGMVNRVVPPERCVDEAVALAAEIAARAPLAVRAAKRLINEAFESPMSAALEMEREEFHILFESQDRTEGMKAYVEKRTPVWKGK